MATIQLKDSNNVVYHFEVSGAGTVGDPFVPLSDLSVAGVPVNDASPVPVYSPDGSGVTLKDIAVALKNLYNVMVRPIWTDPTTGRLNVATVNAVTTVGACSSVNQLASQDAKQTLLYSTDRNLWTNSIRSRIS